MPPLQARRELRRTSLLGTSVNKESRKGPQPRRTLSFPLFPPLTTCFLLYWEELEELRMQSFEEALRDGLNEFIARGLWQRS
jgi:hypothetical protein